METNESLTMQTEPKRNFVFNKPKFRATGRPWWKLLALLGVLVVLNVASVTLLVLERRTLTPAALKTFIDEADSPCPNANVRHYLNRTQTEITRKIADDIQTSCQLESSTDSARAARREGVQRQLDVVSPVVSK